MSRRTIVRVLGASLAGACLGVGGTTAAQSDDASIEIDDQESDGESVVVKTVDVPVDAELLILSGRTVFGETRVDADDPVTDLTVELSVPIEESMLVRAQLQADGEYLTGDQALIAVGEPLSDARSSFGIPSGRVDLIEPDPEAGFRLPYALYTPNSTPDAARPLLVEPLNQPGAETGSDLRSQVRSTAATSPLFSAAHDLGLPGIVPGIPRTPNDTGTEIPGLALPSVHSPGKLDELATDAFPAASLRRVDRQVVGMIQDAKGRLADDGYPVASTIHMTGFSASAHFSTRFALLYPSLINAVTVGGDGAHPLPRASIDGVELPYPLGIADYESVVGQSFDSGRWSEIAQYIYVGREDQPLPDTDRRSYWPISPRYEERAVEVFGENRVTERLPVTRSVYEDAGADATFRIYDGVGHRLTGEIIDDVRGFHRDRRGTADDWPEPTDLPFSVAEAAATPTSTSTSTPTPTEMATETATPTPTTSSGDATTASSTPGFGLPAALVGLGSAAYLFGRRSRDGDE